MHHPTVRDRAGDALDPDVQNFVEPDRLSDDQWIGEKELIERIAEDANRKNWIESESEEEEESEAESTDEETQEASKETVGERLARKEAAKEARKEEAVGARGTALAKARAKDEERKRLRAEREAKAASNKKKTPVKKKVTLDATPCVHRPTAPRRRSRRCRSAVPVGRSRRSARERPLAPQHGGERLKHRGGSSRRTMGNGQLLLRRDRRARPGPSRTTGSCRSRRTSSGRRNL